MKAIVLAAGYGTRLQAVIGDTPKALVKVGDQLVLDYLMMRLAEVVSAPDTLIVSNARYYDQFLSWQQDRGHRATILNDGSMTAETRLGAVRDIQFAVDSIGPHEDLLILAADNILLFGLHGLLQQQNAKGGIHIGIRHNPDNEDQRRRGVVNLDGNVASPLITAFKEKPATPTSNWAAAPIYLLPSSAVPAVNEFLAAGGNGDSPGYLMEYLAGRYPVYGWLMPGEILDIGNPDSLAVATARLTPPG